MKLHTNDKDLKEIALKAFPDYTGRKFSLQITEHKYSTFHDNHWGGGSRTYYKIMRLSDGKIFTVPENGTPFTPDFKLPEKFEVPGNGYIIVSHVIFCGKDLGIRIIADGNDIVKELDSPSDKLSNNEIIVLVATRSLKSSYNGISNFRQYEAKKDTGISEQNYNIALESLITKGFLAKNKSITNSGRNYLEINGFSMVDLYNLKNKLNN